jgi:hypothetical protein
MNTLITYTSPGNSTNMVLATVAPTQNVSTLGQALVCALESARLGHGCDYRSIDPKYPNSAISSTSSIIFLSVFIL